MSFKTLGKERKHLFTLAWELTIIDMAAQMSLPKEQAHVKISYKNISEDAKMPKRWAGALPFSSFFWPLPQQDSSVPETAVLWEFIHI